MSSAAVVAHRGASGIAPENTITSFDLAVALGSDLLELDVRMTSDGVPVVHHDRTLARTARPSRRDEIALLTRGEIARLDVGSWFNESFPTRGGATFLGLRPLCLDEVLQRYGALAGLCIELKDPARHPRIEAKVVSALERAGLIGRGPHPLVVQSFDLASLVRLRGLRPHIALVLLTQPGVPKARIAEALGRVSRVVDGVTAHAGSVDGRLVRQLHDSGLTAGAWTANHSSEMARLLDCGVDAIVTDHPGRLRDLVVQRAARPAAVGLTG